MFFKLIPLACILVYCLSTVSGDCIGIYLPSGTCWGIPVRKLGRHVLLKPLPCQFVFFDQDNDGFVTRNEFAHATRDHKVSLSAKTAVYQLLDKNSDDQIDKSEFLNNAKILQKKSVFKGCHI